jgi:hypothetical protein
MSFLRVRRAREFAPIFKIANHGKNRAGKMVKRFLYQGSFPFEPFGLLQQAASGSLADKGLPK